MSSVQQWNICICATVRIAAFVLAMIKENLTICRLYDLYVILKDKGSHMIGALSPTEHNSEVLNISLNSRAFCKDLFYIVS